MRRGRHGSSLKRLAEHGRRRDRTPERHLSAALAQHGHRWRDTALESVDNLVAVEVEDVVRRIDDAARLQQAADGEPALPGGGVQALVRVVVVVFEVGHQLLGDGQDAQQLGARLVCRARGRAARLRGRLAAHFGRGRNRAARGRQAGSRRHGWRRAGPRRLRPTWAGPRRSPRRCYRSAAGVRPASRRTLRRPASPTAFRPSRRRPSAPDGREGPGSRPRAARRVRARRWACPAAAPRHRRRAPRRTVACTGVWKCRPMACAGPTANRCIGPNTRQYSAWCESRISRHVPGWDRRRRRSRPACRRPCPPPAATPPATTASRRPTAAAARWRTATPPHRARRHDGCREAVDAHGARDGVVAGRENSVPVRGGAATGVCSSEMIQVYSASAESGSSKLTSGIAEVYRRVKQQDNKAHGSPPRRRGGAGGGVRSPVARP